MKKNLIFLLIIIALFICTSKQFFKENVEETNKKNMWKNIELTAHRGLSEYYPENTMEAFTKAYEVGADWIELDVQQTKDNVIIVFHDDKFKRVANINKNIWSLTYKEIQKINVGLYMNRIAKVPTLDEVLKWAKENNVKLNIELKDNGHSDNLVESVIDLINSYEYKNNILLASQNYKFLIEAKDYDSSIKTVYVGRKIEDINDYIAADIFSITKVELTKELVDLIHTNNKKVFIWTIINEKEALVAYDYGVDNIIANDVEFIRDSLEKYRELKEY